MKKTHFLFVGAPVKQSCLGWAAKCLYTENINYTLDPLVLPFFRKCDPSLQLKAGSLI